MTQSLKIECLVTDLALEGEIASFLVTKEQLTAGLSKKADLVEGKIRESNLPDFIANSFQTINQKLVTLEESIADGIQSAKDYSEAYTNEKLIVKADLVDGKVPQIQLPTVQQYEGLSEALNGVLDQARRDMIERTDEIQRTKADLGEDGKVVREQLPNYDKIPGLETVVADLYDLKANADDVETSFKESQEQLDAHSLLLQSLGSILPYNPSNTYAEDSITLKDGILQQIIGGVWKPFKRNIEALYLTDASGETQQQVNYNGGSKWHYRDGGYQENERVVLDNGDVVRNTIDGNLNNPNSNMSGWVNPFEQVSQLLFPFVTMERLGGGTSDSGSKNVAAVREYFRGAKTGEYGTLLLSRGRYNLNDSVVSTCPVSIKGIGTSVNDTGAYSAFVDNRSEGDGALIKFSRDQSVIGIDLDGFEVIGNNRVAAGIEFDISGWVTHVNSIVVRDFKKQGVIFQKTNDGLFSDLRILGCGSKIDGVAYYALDMNPTLTNLSGGSNQLNFVRLHIEHSRYFMRMQNWLCNFYGAHFEIGGASKIVNSLDWSTPLIDVGAVSYQNNFYGCNFVYPSIYLLYRANSKVGGADFFNTCAPIFGSTLNNIGMQNPVATNVMSFDGCSFIPNGGTGTDADNIYMYGYKLFNLPFAQVKLNNCSIERLVSNNYGGHIVASRAITLNNSIFHSHVVTQANIDNDPTNATLLTNFSTAILTKFIRVISNDAAYSSVIGNKFYSFNATQMVDDLSTNAVYSSANFVVANNSGITNKVALPSSITVSSQDFKNSNLLFQLKFDASVAQSMLADSAQGTFYVTRTTPDQNKIQRYISVASTGLYEQNLNGHYTYPVTSGTGGLGLSTNVFKEVHVQDLAVYPPASNIPTTNGEMTFELTSNTQLTVKVKGSDGIVRSAVLTLA